MYKTFKQIVSEEITKPTPGGKEFLALKDKIRKFVRNLCNKFGWNVTPPHLRQDVNQVEDDAITDVVIYLLDYYRNHTIKTNLTPDATFLVINLVRKWIDAQKVEGTYISYFTQEELENLSSGVGTSFMTSGLVELGELYKLKIIDLLECYFLLAVYQGEMIQDAANMIQWSENNARACLFYGRKKVQAYIEANEAGQPLKTKATNVGGRPRQPVDHNLLMNALRILTLPYSSQSAVDCRQ
jgi:hypothetical protein